MDYGSKKILSRVEEAEIKSGRGEAKEDAKKAELEAAQKLLKKRRRKRLSRQKLLQQIRPVLLS